LLLFIERIAPVPVAPKEEKPSEQRFKLSLKERPQAPKEALVKNTIPKPSIAPPMPKGEQLKTPTPISKPKPPVEKPKEQPKQPQTTPVSQPAPKPLSPPVPQEPKKAFERHVAKEVATIERKPQPKKEFNLYDSLATADESPKKSLQSTIKSTDSVQKLYGDKFGELSEGEQKYILDNHEAMRRITQAVLNRYGRSRIPDNLRANDINMVEFYLHPDGSMSGMRLLKNSQFAILDDTTRETIEIAYKDYPRPEQKTYIRYRVWYNLNY
jgi:TonB family protein